MFVGKDLVVAAGAHLRLVGARVRALPLFQAAWALVLAKATLLALIRRRHGRVLHMRLLMLLLLLLLLSEKLQLLQLLLLIVLLLLLLKNVRAAGRECCKLESYGFHARSGRESFFLEITVRK